MKKMVVVGLLSLCSPLISFADTSNDVPDSALVPSQEQVIESSPIIDGSTTDSQENTSDISTEGQNATETTSSIQESDAEKLSSTEESATVDQVVETSTTESTKVEDTTTLETEAAIIPELVEKKTIPLTAKRVATITVPLETPPDENSVTQGLFPEYLREFISNNKEYGVSEKELKSYTDKDLETAFSLFAAYSGDIKSMSLDKYVKVLRMIYRDKVISVADLEKALSFNLNSLEYTTSAELAKDLNKLQFYLRTLYSYEDGFFPMRTFTNEEMLRYLDYFSAFEEELGKRNHFFSGFIHWLYYTQNEADPTKGDSLIVVIGSGPNELFTLERTKLNETAKSKIESLTVASTIPNTAKRNNLASTPQAQQAVGQQNSQKKYPATGENSNPALTLLGIVSFLTAGIIIFKQRTHS